MTIAQLIARKRDGEELRDEDIANLIDGYVAGDVPDYQMSAFAMAVYFRGMSAAETVSLTKSLLDSGEQIQWTNDAAPRVDKHSTGGIGDKISLILAPLLACFDLQVPMISGRGLGITGGTLDKLEAIPGFRTDLSITELKKITADVGCVITGASDTLAPADRKLYALRDVTGTVASRPLIVSSILSKKLAENLDSLVLDVKAGSGAFMKTVDDATKLAHALVEVSSGMGVNTTALVTDMNQPLGRMVGNAVEVQETIDVLSRRGHGTADVVELTVRLGCEILVAQQIASDEAQAHLKLLEVLRDGRAYEKFQQMISAQGGSSKALESLKIAPATELVAEQSGFMAAIDGEAIGNFVIQLGGGRQRVTDKIDHSVGVEVLVRVGDSIEKGQPLAKFFSKQEVRATALHNAFTISEDIVEKLPLVYQRIETTDG